VSPHFLSVDDVVAIHADQVARYGGANVLRDRGLLISAVEMPRATFGGEFEHEDPVHDGGGVRVPHRPEPPVHGRQ